MTTIEAHTEIEKGLLQLFRAVRRTTMKLVEPLSAEDCTTQSMPDASPAKWHLGHTSWFFERLVVEPSVPGYERFDSAFYTLFNSYYNSLGKPHPRPQRGILSRPSLDHVFSYRAHVDRLVDSLLEDEDGMAADVKNIIELGLHHEQQHQELLLMDIKHLFSCNPLKPAYSDSLDTINSHKQPLDWVAFPEGLQWIGRNETDGAFAYDNETPRHRVFTEAFVLGNRLVTNRDYLEFMDDGGYRTPGLWLSNGWATVQERDWNTPLYWEETGHGWSEFTLGGIRDLDLDAPVSHVSYYEADAFARWAGARLPTEAEWEVASESAPQRGNFVEQDQLHPMGLRDEPRGLAQMKGDVWEWTKSGYEPYPGYEPPPGPLGEYNSKFMCSQLVLRGGACVTPASHIRNTYRNFFPPEARWQFSGIRLCKDGA